MVLGGLKDRAYVSSVCDILAYHNSSRSRPPWTTIHPPLKKQKKTPHNNNNTISKINTPTNNDPTSCEFSFFAVCALFSFLGFFVDRVNDIKDDGGLHVSPHVVVG